jgi:hypothetical protein
LSLLTADEPPPLKLSVHGPKTSLDGLATTGVLVDVSAAETADTDNSAMATNAPTNVLIYFMFFLFCLYVFYCNCLMTNKYSAKVIFSQESFIITFQCEDTL